MNSYGDSTAVSATSQNKVGRPADDDDDVDLFGSDEEDEDAAKVREERLKMYAAKKSNSKNHLSIYFKIKSVL